MGEIHDREIPTNEDSGDSLTRRSLGKRVKPYRYVTFAYAALRALTL